MSPQSIMFMIFLTPDRDSGSPCIQNDDSFNNDTDTNSIYNSTNNDHNQIRITLSKVLTTMITTTIFGKDSDIIRIRIRIAISSIYCTCKVDDHEIYRFLTHRLGVCNGRLCTHVRLKSNVCGCAFSQLQYVCMFLKVCVCVCLVRRSFGNCGSLCLRVMFFHYQTPQSLMAFGCAANSAFACSCASMHVQAPVEVPKTAYAFSECCLGSVKLAKQQPATQRRVQLASKVHASKPAVYV